MTTVTDPPADSFKLSMLVYDTRYRSITFQVIALIAFLLFFGWLTLNTIQNLSSLGKEISFSFMRGEAGYDINQRLIEYNSQSTHLRAAIVGLLNTLVVAVMGCVTATIVGVLVGVLRLSNNWLIARLMTVYVEIFRNVPVLMWIVLCMAILIEALPPPSAFRGENPTSSLIFFETTALTNRGVYVPEPLFSRSLGDVSVGGAFNVSVDLLAIILVLIAGFYASSRIRNWAEARQNATGLRPRTWHLRLGVVLIPLVVLLVATGFHLGYPSLQGFNFAGGTHLRNSLIALWLALSLYTAAFVAEIVRAGILAIPDGQTEAAAALGLRPSRITRLVILPQALRVIVPPLISQYLNLTKNSSLAIAVGYMDLTGTLMGITLNQTGRELETVLLGMLIYLLISLMISAVMNVYNSRVKLVER